MIDALCAGFIEKDVMMKERIAQCFNKGAQTYDAAAIVQAKVAQQLAQRLHNVSAQTILEIGCGTGYFSQILATRFPNASLHLTDIAPAMIAMCKRRFSSSPSIKFACMDGEALTLQETFDLIISSMTLHWFADIKNSFAKIIEKISSHGQFHFAMLGEHSLIEWREMCEKNNLPIPTPSFPSRQILQNQFPEIKLESEIIKQKYPSIYDFLGSLKDIGATATCNNYSPLSAGKLRQLMQENDKEINISYEIIYGSYVKP